MLEVVLLLDAFDEMKPEFRSKNLCTNNDLEQLHNCNREKIRVPRVVFLCRSELFAGQEPESYHPLFSLPGSFGAELGKNLLELKVASFSSRLADYLELSCALQVRQV